MKKTVLAFMLALAMSGCGEQPSKLLETAQFEEKQFNSKHAAELYRQILKDHPQSPEAATARARLAELEKTP